MNLTVYFLRHGQTAHSRDDVFCGSGTDALLTQEGEEMAKQFATAYASVVWEGVYCSPQTRAQQTIRPLIERIKRQAVGQSTDQSLAVQVREGLCEISYGEWENCPVPDIRKKFSDTYLAWTNDPLRNAPLRGENASQIAARGRAVLEEIRKKHQSGNVLVVSHKATIRVMISDLLGLDLQHYRYRLSCPVCSLSMLEFTDRGPLLRSLADREHLSKELRSLPG